MWAVVFLQTHYPGSNQVVITESRVNNDLAAVGIILGF